jgi:nucleoside-diphosphate-sugar epimerase
MAETRVLVTGGTGFIGGRLVRRLLQEGYRVRVLCLPNDPGADGMAAAGAEVLTGDLTDGDAVDTAVANAERIFHCAGVVTDWAPRRLFDRVHIGGITNLLRAAVRQRVRRFIWISTNDVFGVREDRVLTEDDDLRPWSEPYPDTKIAAERLAWRAYQRCRLPVATVYPCWVYGPGDTTFVPLLAEAILERQMIFWRRNALVWPAYVDNVVDLLVRIGWDDSAVGQGYLVHDGVSLTLQAFCRRLADHLGVAAPRMHIPYGAAYGLAGALELIYATLGIRSRPLLTTYAVTNLGSRLRFSIDKARRELRWVPPTRFEEGFARAMEWLDATGPASRQT